MDQNFPVATRALTEPWCLLSGSTLFLTLPQFVVACAARGGLSVGYNFINKQLLSAMKPEVGAGSCWQQVHVQAAALPQEGWRQEGAGVHKRQKSGFLRGNVFLKCARSVYFPSTRNPEGLTQAVLTSKTKGIEPRTSCCFHFLD